MPGKVNPVIPEVVTQVAAQVIGNDAAITVGGMQGHFELNVFIPMMARNLLQSIALLSSASRLLAEKCVDGIEANIEQCERYAELTLSAATALNPYIGYDKASEIVKEASRSGRSLREVAREAGVEDSVLDRRSTTTPWPSRTPPDAPVASGRQEGPCSGTSFLPFGDHCCSKARRSARCLIPRSIFRSITSEAGSIGAMPSRATSVGSLNRLRLISRVAPSCSSSTNDQTQLPSDDRQASTRVRSVRAASGSCRSRSSRQPAGAGTRAGCGRRYACRGPGGSRSSRRCTHRRAEMGRSAQSTARLCRGQSMPMARVVTPSASSRSSSPGSLHRLGVGRAPRENGGRRKAVTETPEATSARGRSATSSTVSLVVGHGSHPGKPDSVRDSAPTGLRSVPLLVGPVARADERAGEDRAKAECFALLAQPAELVGVYPAVDLACCFDGWRYCPIVTTSTPCARRSAIVSTTSSFVSPSPTMIPDFVRTA